LSYKPPFFQKNFLSEEMPIPKSLKSCQLARLFFSSQEKKTD
jgi:hypothetical protein